MADRHHETLLALIEARRRDDVAAAVRDVCEASGFDRCVPRGRRARVVGGGAFPGPTRARALGADEWSDTLDEVDATLRAWAAATPPLAAPTVPEPALPRGRDRAALLERALAAMAERVPLLAGDGHHETTRRLGDLDAVLGSIEAALRVADPTIVDEHVAWFATVSEARGEPAGLAALAVEALSGVLPDGLALPGELALEA